MTTSLVSDTSFAWLDSIMGDLPSSTHSLQASASPRSVSRSSSHPIQSAGSPTSSRSLKTPKNNPSSSRNTSFRVDTSNGASSSKASSSNPLRRRIRPKIALDPSQPPTAEGKPRARVYVACNQCRIRKTRCDGAKPICFNCRKRPPEEGDCNYDPLPKRRGQDKVPGTRLRAPSSRPSKRRRGSSGGDDHDHEHEHSDSDSTNSTSPHSAGYESHTTSRLQASYESFPMLQSDDEYDPFPLVDLDPPPVTDFEYELGRYKGHDRNDEQLSIPPRPSLQFTRETWWDALLTLYSTEDCSTDMDIITLTPDQRTSTVHRIVSDLRALFHSSFYWVSFIYLPRFFDALLTPARRTSMQPALALSALAVGKLAQGSEAEQGARGRAKALKLLDIAHGALQASLASGWVDIGLIQAAWLIVYFEMQSHPIQSVDRGRSSLLLLDSLIRLFSLTTLDADIKRAAGAVFPPSTTSYQEKTGFPTSQPGHLSSTSAIFIGTGAPGYFETFPNSANAFTMDPSVLPPVDQVVVPIEPIVPDHIVIGLSTAPPQSLCHCAALSLGHNFPSIRDIAPSWAGTLMWPENVTEGEFRKEECRRLVWASVMVTASMNSYTSVLEDIERNKLWIKDPSNYALLFPAEALAMSGVPVPAHNVWTLYLRAMLLLHKCVRKRGDMTTEEADRARFTMQAWLEVDAIENALNQHTCELERNFGYQAREMLFSARMCMSHEFQRYIPQVTTNGRLFYRDKAETWLQHRMFIAERLWNTLNAGLQPTGLSYRKPLLIYWFMSHLIKALVLWKADNSLIIALHAAKTFVKRAEYLMMFWPSAEQRREWAKLRMQLVEACIKCGVSPPETTLPGPIPRGMAPSS